MQYRILKRKSMNNLKITCGDCKYFIPKSIISIKQFRCKYFTLREVEEHTSACERRFDSIYEG